MVGTTFSTSSNQQQQQQTMISSSNTSNTNTNFFRYYGSVLIVSTGIILFESIILYQLLHRRTTRHQQEQQQEQEQQENRDSDDRTTTVDEKEQLQQEQEQQQQQQQDEHQNKLTTKCIYLDYNGTTPIYKEIYDSMKPYFLYHFGNPSSKHHSYGQQPYSAIEYARQQIRTMLLFGAAVAETTTTTTPSFSSSNIPSIIFTGCGTEANNLAISLAIQKYYTNTNYNHPSNDPSWKKQQQLLPHIVTTNIEHPAIEQCLLYYETNQLCTVTYVPVQSDGRVVAKDVINAIRRTNNNETALVTVMYANNESGALQPVQEIAEYCYANNILMHIDAAQAVGKVSMEVTTTLGNPAMVTIVGHKIGAPKGIACLYIRDGSLDDGVLVVNDDDTSNQQQPYNTKYHGLLFGGGQESGFRPGTENVPYIVALGKACEICTMQWEANNIHMESLRTLLINELYKLIPHSYETLRIHGPSDPTQRLPNTVSIGIRNIHSGILLSTIGQFVAASAGAACHSVVASSSSSEEEDTNDNHARNEYSSVSSVLRAMQIPLEYAKGTIRLSIGPTTTANEIRTAAQIIATAVQDQWSVSSSSSSLSSSLSNRMTTKPPTSITNGTTTTTTASSAAVETIRNTIPPTPMNNVYTFPDRFELNV